MEYKIQHAQKCLYCGKYLLRNEQVGTYTYEDMKDWLGHVECANLHMLGKIEERAKDIILGEPYLASTIEIVEIEVTELATVIHPSNITEYEQDNYTDNKLTTKNKSTEDCPAKLVIDLTNDDDEMDISQ